MKLNFGCGNTKYPGYVNVDIDKALEPDFICDIRQKLPWEDKSIEEVICIHTIEHIQKIFHLPFFDEVHRILKEDGLFVLAYPEFSKCLQNWLDNKVGMRDIWEATIYGRQLSPTDTHLSAMHTPEVTDKLLSAGFKDIQVSCEPTQFHNTVIKCTKGVPLQTYEEAIGELYFAKGK